MARLINGKPLYEPDIKTCIGALPLYITTAEKLQPMNANFGIMHLSANVKKKDRKAAYAPQSLALIRQMKESHVL